MIRKSKLYIILFILLFLLTACRSTKSERVSLNNDTPLLQQLRQMPAVKNNDCNISAKLNLLAGIDGKSISSKGTFSVDRGKGIRIGITAMGLFEIARLDISTDAAYFINKIGKEYVALNYFNVELLGRIGLNYDILESIFMNRPFSPDGAEFTDIIQQSKLSSDSIYIKVSTGKRNNMQYDFTFNKLTGELVRTEGLFDNSKRVICEYDNFEKLTNRTFPCKINLIIEGYDRTVGLELKLSNIKENVYNFKVSDISGYKPIEFSRILELLK